MSTTRPIIFSAPMVRALLAGTKTQTRRIIKPQPLADNWHAVSLTDSPDYWEWWALNGGSIDGPADHRRWGETNSGRHRHPYGQPGNRLWVRETWAALGNEDGHPTNAAGQLCSEREAERFYRADAEGWEYGMEKMPGGRHFDGRWSSPIHMPRWASRITLEVTGVRVERLQDISDDDARAEGATSLDIPKPWGAEKGWSMDWSRIGNPNKYAANGATLAASDVCLSSPRWAFCNYINKINGMGTWESNPWVWVVEFRRVAP